MSRKEIVQVPLNPIEYKLVQDMAESQGVSMAEIFRDALQTRYRVQIFHQAGFTLSAPTPNHPSRLPISVVL